MDTDSTVIFAVPKLEERARRCKELEDDYVAKRQHVALDELSRLHVDMADAALASHLTEIRDACNSVGGVFATRVSVQIDTFLIQMSKK